MENEHYIRTMECPACHYRYSYDCDDRKMVEGKNKFIDVDMTATYDDNDYYQSTRKLNVVMCPECGVLIGNR